MDDFTMPLLLDLDVVSLAMSLVNIESATGDEHSLASSLEDALTPLPHLDVERIGNTVVARTQHRGSTDARVLVAGHIDTHLDTSALESTPLTFDELGKLFGAGACDAKGALAVMLKAALTTYERDVAFVFYAGTEGLDALASARPKLVAVDLAVLLEPTAAGVSTAHATHPEFARLVGLADAAPIAPPGCSGVAALDPLGIPTAAFGPGDPRLAHSADEFVPTAELTQCEYVLRTWLLA